MIHEINLIEKFRDTNFSIVVSQDRIQLHAVQINSDLHGQICEARVVDEFIQKKKRLLGQKGVLRFNDRICVHNDLEIKKIILSEAHKSKLSIHLCVTKMHQDLKRMFWWPKMKKEVAQYLATCLICQKAKIEHQKPARMLQSLDILVWKWDNITMDFVFGLPQTIHKFDSIWVIVDKLTKSANFLPINIRYSLEKLIELYIREIVRLYGVPSSIISNRDPRCASRFWGSLHHALGAKLRLNSTYHPQTDGKLERTIQSLEDLLRACVLEDSGSWDQYLPLIEFTYNNSSHSSIGMALYEALYGRKCITPLCWFETRENLILGPEMVQQTTEKIKMIQEKLIMTQSRQKSCTDKRRQPLEFQEGYHVFLKVTPTTIGHVAYQISLPPFLSILHNVFHVSQLRKYISDLPHVIMPDTIQLKDNLTYETMSVQIADKRIEQLRGKQISLVKVIWNEDTGHTTWE
uniref:Transposon Ty3-I Gag-Pol polyprotein n=1 Tax=Cajanus cajan TaxID=3821 RepID=A0A151TS54_CAJCA|nr:Transposon Ty3-I Gag-Pol polyprotein [Cajanus cajan]